MRISNRSSNNTYCGITSRKGQIAPKSMSDLLGLRPKAYYTYYGYDSNTHFRRNSRNNARQCRNCHLPDNLGLHCNSGSNVHYNRTVVMSRLLNDSVRMTWNEYRFMFWWTIHNSISKGEWFVWLWMTFWRIHQQLFILFVTFSVGTYGVRFIMHFGVRVVGFCVLFANNLISCILESIFRY
jgi:hypothetical protein